jgi:small conductance mechanosensitive channel
MRSKNLAGVRDSLLLLALTTALCFPSPASAAAAEAETDDAAELTIATPAGVGSAEVGSAEVDSFQDQAGEQEPDSAPPALSDLERADSLLQAASALSDSAFALAQRIPGTRGEDRALLGQRIRRLVAEGEELTRPLLRLLDSLDQSDPRVQVFNETSTTETTARNADLQGLIEAVRAEVDEADQARDTVSAEGLVAFDEMRLSRSQTLDQALTALYDNNAQLGRLGGDTIPTWEFLDPVVTARAEDLAARIEYRREQIRSLRSDIAASGEVAPAELRLELDSHQRGLERNLVSLGVMADLLEGRGVPTAPYRELLVLSGGGITTDILRPSIVTRLVNRGWGNLSAWVMANIGNWMIRAAVFFLILFIFWSLGRIVKRLVKRGVSRSNLGISVLFQQTLVVWAGRVVVLMGLLIALGQAGVNLAPILAGLGVAGFVVGFALQDTLANFAAGVMILVYRPYDVDDVVEAAGVFGKVATMNLVSTTINTFDNQTLVVPNGKIWGEVIRNVTAQRVRRVDLTFGIGYGDDIPKAEGILRRLVEEHPATLDDPEPIIKVHNLGDSSVDFIVRPWCKTDDYWDVFWDLTRSVKLAFDAEGVSIPFPQRDVHLYTERGAGVDGRGEGEKI